MSVGFPAVHVTIFRRRTQEIRDRTGCTAYQNIMWYVFLTTCCFRDSGVLGLLLEIDMLCACVRDIGIVTGCRVL